MDFLLRNKIYLLPVVLVALMFGYFFYFSFNFNWFAEDFYIAGSPLYDRNIIKAIIEIFKPHSDYRITMMAYRNSDLFSFILKYDMEFYGKYFMTSIFMSSTFVIFMYVLSWYLNFRFLFTVKNKILKDSGIFLIIFIIFIAINNSLMNLFWYSSFSSHIFNEMLLFLMIISYVRLFNSSNFEKMENKGFVYKFLLYCYLLILSYLVGNGTESTSLFAILVIFVLVIYLIKKYKKIYFWYFFPLITLFYGLYVQVVVLNTRVDIDKNKFLLDKINHFFVYFFKNLWFGYKYFLIFILGYLIVLFLKYFKKINIVNRKDFNISSVFLLGFFVNLAILVILLAKGMFLYVPYYSNFNNMMIIDLFRWYTMADVFLGLFILYFCWFLIKEFKHKKNIKYIIGLLFLVIFSNFVMNNIVVIQKSNYYNKNLIKPKNELLNKIKNEISLNDCYSITPKDLETISLGFTKEEEIKRMDTNQLKNHWMWINELYYGKIDINKIKFEGTCDLKNKKVKR
jgi:hypothetical protein